MKKVLFVLAAVAMVCFMTTSAMAGSNTTRSAEMTANSICDQAGTIQYFLSEADWGIIDDYLYNQGMDYVEIRVTLTGTDIELDDDQPFLCKDIMGSAVADGVPHSGDLVALDILDAEISDVVDSVNNVADFEAYVWGDGDVVNGDQRFFIYITDLGQEPNWNNPDETPWMKVGLYTDIVDVSTAICANILDYEGFNKLTIANDVTPQSITFTGDVEIGHFQEQDYIVRDCGKTEIDSCDIEEEIQLCDVEDIPNVDKECPTYTHCIVVEGDFPAEGDFTMQIKSETDGVYLVGVSLGSYGSPSSWTPYESDCTTGAVWGGGCAYDAKCAVSSTLNFGAVGTDDEVKLCVTYEVDYANANVGDFVEFTVSGETLPCGALFTDTITGAELVACKGITDCMYFPYVLTGSSPWSTGLVVANLSDDSVAADAMEVTFVLTDSNGDSASYTKKDFTSVVWSANLDSQLADWGMAPAPGNAWLQVITNFPVDGYSYLSNGNFGAGTLPRLDMCNDLDEE